MTADIAELYFNSVLKMIFLFILSKFLVQLDLILVDQYETQLLFVAVLDINQHMDLFHAMDSFL